MTRPVRMTLIASIAAIVSLYVNAAPALAFDCSKAASKVEKAICADQALIEADNHMSASYKHLYDGYSAKDRKALRQSQRQWLKRRGWCENYETPISDCILRETTGRTRLLTGRPDSGNAGKLQPMFVVQKGTTTQYDINIDLLRFKAPATPGEAAFNAAIDAILAGSPVGKTHDKTDVTRQNEYQLSMTVPFASPAFISARLFTYEYTGGAHGNTSTRNINIDLRSGASVGFGDLFKPPAAAIFIDSCVAQIEKIKHERFGADGQGLYSVAERREIISETIPDINNWSFAGQQASVIFDPYEIGAYVEGRYECHFQMDVVRAQALPGSPLSQTGD
ncbi:MAG: DUF4163 domain-containing protein [Hyphomicrobiales bacterium]|nr:DUF4163 domain-containing protein [Hyphomicrobiales bacterium]